MRRPVRIIPDNLFSKIVDECSRHRLAEVHLHNFGEPLLDADLEDKIKLVKQKCRVRTKIFTNGSLLTSDRINRLLNSGIDEIKISIDGSTPKEFEQIRPPLKWSEIYNNIKALIETRNILELKTRIYITGCTGQSVRNLFDFPIDFAIGPKHNWGGQYGDEKAGRFVRCNRLWRTFTILVDGMVAQCHADVHGQYCLGNIHKQTIEEVWNCPEYNTIRDMHTNSRQAELELCRNCSQCRS
jgi:radical SAM protein with 4Fe4S-binding SPASM domain